MSRLIHVISFLNKQKTNVKIKLMENRVLYNLLEASFMNCPLGGALYDNTGKLIDINNVLLLDFELKTKCDFLIPDIFESPFLEEYQIASLRNKNVIFCKDPFSFKVEPVCREGEETLGYILWKTDLEESALRREKDLLSAQLKDIHMLMNQALADGKLSVFSFNFDRFHACDRTSCNRCFQFYGRTNTLLDRNRFICRILKSVVHPDDNLDFFFLFNKIHDEKLEDYQVLFQLKNLEDKFIMYQVSGKGVEPDAKGYPRIILGTISEKKAADYYTSDEQENLRNLDRLKSNFLGNMAHEIRTPLNAIVGFSDELMTEDDAESREEYIRIIKQNNEHLLNLMNDLLEMSRVESNALKWIYENISLKHLLESIFERMKDKCPANITLFMDDVRDVILYGDKLKLNATLMHLLRNAINFTREGEIHFGYQVYQDVGVQFYVSDTGCGISIDKWSSIFEKFVQLNSFHPGTGLGLTLCKHYVTGMGGSIWLESEEQVGSTFYFSIPLKKL